LEKSANVTPFSLAIKEGKWLKIPISVKQGIFIFIFHFNFLMIGIFLLEVKI